jgi:hypothetical protein
MSSPSPSQRSKAQSGIPAAQADHPKLAQKAPAVLATMMKAGVRLLRCRRFGEGGGKQPERGKPVAQGHASGPQMETLVYELLDAHGDTTAIASELAKVDERWQQHLAYLQSLQRTGREVLAHLSAQEAQ